MHSALRITACLGFSLWAASVHAQDYSLRFAHPQVVGGVVPLEGVSGTGSGPIRVRVAIDSTAGAQGIRGWSLGVAHDPLVLELVSATVAGTEGDVPGFSSVDIVAGGVVSSVLVGSDPTGVLASGASHEVLEIEYRGVFPLKDTTVSSKLRFVDGLGGPSGTVDTSVLVRGGETEVAAAARRDSLTILLSGFEYSTLFALALETNGGIPGAEGSVFESFVRAGTHPSYLVRTWLESRLPLGSAEGAQGWSLSIVHDPAVFEPERSTLGLIGTAAGALLSGGFERHDIVDNASGRGVVSAVVLSFVESISLPAQGRVEILRCGYRLVADTSMDGTRILGGFQFQDKLQGGGQPVNNVVTLDGSSHRPLVRRGLSVSLTVGTPPRQPFRRGDPNDDGRANIADAIWILRDLFSGGVVTECLYAADTNSDGLKDVSDGVFLIQYQFLGGAAPAAPFTECGVQAEQDIGLCPIGSTNCP